MDGFTQTSDNWVCIKSILNCATYEISNFTSINLKCSTCINNFVKTTDNLACLPEINECKDYY